MENEVKNKELAAEPIFDQALASSKKSNYLGDYETLDTLLRRSISRLLSGDDHSKKTLQKKIREESVRVSKVLLGQDKSYEPMHNWNSAGHIDEFCAKWLGSLETTPDLRMQHSVIKMCKDILDLVGYAGTNGVLDEQWQFQVTAIVRKYVYTFLGVDFPTQAIMQLQKEQTGGSIEDDQ